MEIFNIFRRKKETNLETRWRENLLCNGRITEGTITDCETTDEGAVVYYYYNIQGADFESSQVLTSEQLRKPLKYAPGAKVGIRYDPKHHGNSILV